MKSDPFSLALATATRSQQQRRAGKHTITDADLTHLFGAEFGLSGSEKGQLLIRLMQLEPKARHE